MVPLLTLLYAGWPLSEVIATSVAVSFGLTFSNVLFFFLKGALRPSMLKHLLPLLLSLIGGAWLVSQWSLSYTPFVSHFLLYGVLLLLAWHLLFPSLSPLKPLLRHTLPSAPSSFASFSSSFSPSLSRSQRIQRKRKWLIQPLAFLSYLLCGLLAGGFLATTGVGAGLLLSAFLWSFVPPKSGACSTSLPFSLKPEHISPLVNVLVCIAAFFSCLSFMKAGLTPRGREDSLWQWGWIHGDVALIALSGAFLSLPFSMKWRGRLSPQLCQKSIAVLLLLTLCLVSWSGMK